MIYPNDFENKIGFTHLRHLLGLKCETAMGADLVSKMSFKSDLQILQRELGSVDEMKSIIEAHISLPQLHLSNTALWLMQAQAPGSYLSAEQLHLSQLTFQSMNEIGKFFINKTISGISIPNLYEYFKDFPSFEELQNEISRCIDKDGNVKDHASQKLYEIRRSLDGLSKSMHKIMRRVLDQSISAGVIDKDSTPVIRDGRMVIPVSSANKRAVQGIVHDASATGKTVFIEPAEMVEAGNRLRELQKEEEQEIIVILIGLTNLLRPYIEDIKRGCCLLALYDFIKAKALFAIETGGEKPVLEPTPEIDWYHAVHPGLLLTLRSQNRETVAMNLRLDEKDRFLIISGPNAGGKSVSLKTAGTIQYMTQCGMLPTMYSNSHVGMFENIFIDIGDEQSMENDLSTYSSHLTNMKFFLQHSNKKTLILADEMGSGTEPQIGAALAQSILTRLGESGCFGIITTHYQNLKVFAENTEGFINGAMLYDRQHLRPTFQLSVGQPGSSFALEIARNIGLPSSIIDGAKELVGSEYVDSEKFILDIQRDKRYWKNKRLEIKEKENKLNRLLEEYEEKADELKHQRATIIRDARQEAKDILKEANARIERSIHEIRKTQADKEKAKNVRKELEDYKQSISNDLPDDKLPEPLKPLRHKSKKRKQETHFHSQQQDNLKPDLKEGDYVKMDSGGVAGRIISIKGNKAEVAFGALRTTTDISKLQPAQKPKTEVKNTVFSQSSPSDTSRTRQLNFKNEIDVRGFRADEALQAITYFLDDAIQFDAGRVRILHGTGHGILRTLIRQHLQANPNVARFYDEDVRLGGAGITVVDLE